MFKLSTNDKQKYQNFKDDSVYEQIRVGDKPYNLINRQSCSLNSEG